MLGEINIENTFCGKYYKAYQVKNRIYLSQNDKKSIKNRIAIYNKYVVRLGHTQYYDYIYGVNEDFRLQQFLGLPEELEINYSKSIIPQLKFSKRIAEIENPKEPFYATITTIFDKKQKKDISAELRHQNACIERGFLYLPNIKDAYVVLDKMSKADKEKIIPSITQFKIKDTVFKYDSEKGGPIPVPNPHKKGQEQALKEFFLLPTELLAEIFFRPDKKDLDLKRIYKKYRLDKRYIAIEREVDLNSVPQENRYSRIMVFLSHINIYSNLYNNLCVPIKSWLTQKDKERERMLRLKKEKAFDRRTRRKYFGYCLKRFLLLQKKPAFRISRKDIKTLFYLFDDAEENLNSIYAFFDWIDEKMYDEEDIKPNEFDTVDAISDRVLNSLKHEKLPWRLAKTKEQIDYSVNRSVCVYKKDGEKLKGVLCGCGIHPEEETWEDYISIESDTGEKTTILLQDVKKIKIVGVGSLTNNNIRNTTVANEMSLSEEQKQVLEKCLSKEDFDLLMDYYVSGARKEFCDELFCIIAGSRYFDEEKDGLTEEGVLLDKLLTDVMLASENTRSKKK